jgi:hypothetical protein
MTQSLHLPQASADQRQRLLQLLAERAYRHGSFTLASGRSSDHYVNCKPVSLSGEGLALLSARMLELVEAEAVAGRSVEESEGGVTPSFDNITALFNTLDSLLSTPVQITSSD